MTFTQKLNTAWQSQQSLLMVGLDPDAARLPASLQGKPDAIYQFCTAIVDATAPYVCGFKPQIAYFAALRAEEQLEAICQYILKHHPHLPLVLDAKRGDIGSTAEQYAREAFERYGADAVTLSPYLGFESVQPYLSWKDKGVVLLCRTSNPGSAALQMIEDAKGEPLYLRVASMVAQEWNADGQCALVVGATYPEELAKVRARVGDMPLLVPGIGAQGGDIPATVKAGSDSQGMGMMINSSRAILYARKGDDWAHASAEAARETRDAINAARAALASD
ncbi:orotidine-5'-phosphate decarboxylase [Pusillimonas sp. CC-YST705]|uniref:Orotidine 5'-phosphate decarboxylase n=1 Tax=Mesopusillimonas faecipullorum TaxID=2755040 RepID=A0ABS8CBN3_9BURK|nr:orotidine-5'-phosphate decarboxylase [Mesopusillimonas faecipullorum]MCB5363428.1 orotidine-5'-phosphate decarboxylase [Mesopusillimonas faecipullorum]